MRGGGLVVLPTDTVYGVGCDAFDAAAVPGSSRPRAAGGEMPPPVLVGKPTTIDALTVACPATPARSWTPSGRGP